jgi:A/G-specific adenine glycosylase
VRGRTAVLAWYAPRRRAYPWRGTRDPYRVLVSEVMLQQTQASRVASAHRSFARRFATIRALARASRADVVRAWGSLGYNRRAVALSEAAREVVRDHGGGVPADPATLVRLPGVGAVTRAATS